jgi:hypothetical protein
MWYNRTILAAIEDAINALQSKGVSDQIIQFVHSLPNDKKGKAIGALNQNPSMMIDDLKSLFESGYKPSGTEKQLVQDYDPRFQSWALYQYKLQRANKLSDDPRDDRWDYNKPLRDIKDNLDEIQDFFRAHTLDNPNYNIGTKSLEEAYEDSNEWHRAMTERGSGKFYLPFKRDESGQLVDEKIVHRFEDGSMIVRVEDPNDLDVEGNFMHHCVGSYAKSVEYGDCTIYSLRNKFNNPEATIEVGRDGKVKQIKGPNNSEIHDEDKVEKIAEFFEGRDDINKKAGEGWVHQRASEWDPSEVDWSTYPDDLRYSITESAYGPYLEDYGDDDDNGDFARFGITSEDFNQDEFTEQNIRNANMVDLVKEATSAIEEGLKSKPYGRTFSLEDYDINELADTVVSVAFDKLKREVDDIYLPDLAQEQEFYELRGGVDAYKLKTAENLLRNNPLTDLLYHFADQYDEHARYMNDNFGFSLDENEFDLDQSTYGAMDTSSDKLSLEIAKKIFATYENNESVQKFEELLGVQFTLPNLQDYDVEYKPKMSYITGSQMYTEDPAQLRFQDLPEGESFNLARHRKKQLEDGEEELVLPDDFE